MSIQVSPFVDVKPSGFYKQPTGTVGSTFDRSYINSQGILQTTALLCMYACELRAGVVVSNFNFRTGNTASASGGTNQWAGLFDKNRVQLATTSDQALAAMAASTPFTWPVTTIAAGAASSYTVPATDLYYVGLMLKTTNMPSLLGLTGTAGNDMAPLAAASANSAQAGVNAFPFTAGALTVFGSTVYLWLT